VDPNPDQHESAMIFGRLDPDRGGKNDTEKRKKVKKYIVSNSVVDPHWFQCGPRSSFYLNGDPDPGSHEKYT